MIHIAIRQLLSLRQKPQLAKGQEPGFRQTVTMNKDLIAKLLGIGLILAAVHYMPAMIRISITAAAFS
jgi:hypothetical protein